MPAIVMRVAGELDLYAPRAEYVFPQVDEIGLADVASLRPCADRRVIMVRRLVRLLRSS